jgi:hypothetical protein
MNQAYFQTKRSILPKRLITLIWHYPEENVLGYPIQTSNLLSMKSLSIKLMLFFSPFLFIALLIFIVDPYDLFYVSHVFGDEAKLKCVNRSNASSPRGNILWKTLGFKRNPTPNIILGDSRIADVNPDCLGKKLGGKVSNLAIPAGNNKTIVDLFWMAANNTELKNVLIQTNFNRYNAVFNFDLYEPVKQLSDKPFYYFLKWNYIQDAFAVIYYSLFKDEHYVNQSYKYRDDNWKTTEQMITNELSRFDYVYPTKLNSDFQHIANYCKEKHINLSFVIAPDYYESHSYVKTYRLEKEYLRFKKDINALGNTVDLDRGLPFSFNRNNYLDHYHIKPQIADTIVSMIYR